MHKIKIPNKISTSTLEDEKEYRIIPRRRSDRRRNDRRGDRSNQYGRAKQVRRLQGFDDIRFTPIRLGERRQNERRMSKPNLLSADEIVLLRKR